MTKRIWLNVLAFVLNTAAFGYLGYRLFDGASTEFLYLNNDASFVLEGVLLCVPLGLAILWSHADKATYIQNHFGGEYSYGAIEHIENDPTLTPTQKEELKIHLRAWGD